MQIKQYFLMFIFFLIGNSSQATTLTVNTLTDTNTGSGTSGSLRYLMSIAQAGDTINFDASLTGSIILDNTLGNLPQITVSNLTITGNLITSPGVAIGTPKIAIDGQNLPSNSETICFSINSLNSSDIYTIENLSFINFVGTGGYSAGIYSTSLGGTININNCFFGTTDGVTTSSNVFGIALINGTNTGTLNLANSIITASTGAPFQAWGFNEANVSGCIINGNSQPAMDF